MESVLEGMAEYFSAELSVKVKRGMIESFLKGQVTGGGKVYGYDSVDKHYAINEKEAEIVRKIFKDFAGGKTIKDISDWLSQQDINSKTKKPFSYNAIMHILKNKKYIGTLTWCGQSRENAIPVIVDKNIFAQCEARMIRNKRKPSAMQAEEYYLLTHKAYCGYCKSHMVSDSGKGKMGVIYKYYKCRSKKKALAPCCKSQVDKKWFEDLVINETLKLLNKEGMIETIATQVMIYNDQRKENPNLERYETQLAETEKEIQNLLTAIKQGIITSATKEEMLKLESDKADLEWKIDGEKLNAPIKLVYDEVVFWFLIFANGDRADQQFCERLIDTFVNKVVIWNDKVYITYNIKGRDGDKITIDEIIKDFEDEERESIEKAEHKKFDLYQYGAGEGNRTLAASLGSSCSAIKLLPHE